MPRKFLVLLLGLLTATALMAQQVASTSQSAQPGDQMLDGIGETSLVARYQFNGTAEDSSRNQLHGKVTGTGTFVDDGGRRVLLLTGDGSYVQLPTTALVGEDAVAIVGWLYLPTRATGPVFDFGQNAATRFSGWVDTQGFHSSVVVGGRVR